MNSFWDFIIWLFWFYVVIACIWVFITVIVDIFRDHTLNGWAKALWVLFLVFVPFLAAFIYLIARGRGMAERNAAKMAESQAASADYIRSVAGSSASSSASEIEKGKQLLDSGAITPAEFDALKAKALQSA
jgi:high-affinity K+ transport system ATPase subunit B